MSDEVVGELGKAARGGIIALAGLVVSAVFGFLVRAVIGRVYGPEQYGAYNLAFTVFTITLVVAMLGFPMGVQRQVSYFRTKRPEETPNLISTALITVALTSTMGMLLLETTRGILPNYIGGGSLLPDILLVLAVALPPAALFNTLISTSQGFKRVREYVFYSRLFVPVAYFLLTAAVTVLLRLDIVWVVGGYLVVQLIALILIVRDLTKARILQGKPRFSPSLAKVLIAFSIPLVISNIVGLIMTWTDTLMLGHYYGSKTVGIYNAAAPLARFIPVFLAAFTVIYSPIVTSLYAKGKLKDVNRFYGSITRWVILLTFPLFLLLFAYPSPVVGTLFGQKYAAAWLPLMILSIGFLFHSIVGPNGLTLVSIGRPTEDMKGNIIGASMNVAVNLLLIPRYGMEGAAIATALSYVVANLYKQVVLWRMDIRPFNRRYGVVLVLGALITALALLLPTNSLLVSLAIVGALSLVFYIATVLLGAFDETDVELIRLASKKFGLNLDWLIRLIIRFGR